MASTARWGLKHDYEVDTDKIEVRRNGLSSPLGIETVKMSECQRVIPIAGMASPARWGLKHIIIIRYREHGFRRNGLYSPFEGRKYSGSRISGEAAVFVEGWRLPRIQ